MIDHTKILLHAFALLCAFFAHFAVKSFAQLGDSINKNRAPVKDALLTILAN